MKLIGAGLPRTGTLSQKIALEMAGVGPCYHMVNVFADLEQINQWQRAFQGDLHPAEILKGFESTIDWPGSYFYRELMEAHPEAKVLLSVRDGDSWERSMRNTIWDALFGDSVLGDLCRTRARVDPTWETYMETMSAMWEQAGFLGGADPEPGSLARTMERYNDEVIATVPADRLLVWSVAEGWEPLCAFLEIPVPDAPFPQVNDAAELVGKLIDAGLHAIRQWKDSFSPAPAPPAAAPA